MSENKSSVVNHLMNKVLAVVFLVMFMATIPSFGIVSGNEEWVNMPIGDFQEITDDSYNIIKIDAPSSVSKGQKFEVNIEVSPERRSTYESSWIFLTQQDIENTRLFMDKEGFKIDKTDSEISVDYILGKATSNPFALFDLATAGKLLLTHSVAHSIGFDYIFSLLGYATGTGGSPPEWAVKLGENYLLGVADKTQRDIISLLETNNIDPAFMLMKQKIMWAEKKNTMNYKLKLRAPYDEGVYHLTINAEYSILNYYYPSIGLDHSLYYIDNLDALGSKLWERYRLGYRYRLRGHTAYDFKTICVGNGGETIFSVDKGLEWLRDPDQQKTDGDYVYWTYKGTPNVGVTALVTLAFLNHGYDESDPTVKGALNWLVAQANDADGSISCDDRKVYDTSLAILPLVAAQNEAKYGTVKANARKYLISVQNNEGTGYDHSDRFYGGWGYPKDNWADLSNTQFVVMALDASGGLTGGVKDNALTFVTRCQNRKESNADYCSYDDGGFVYQPKSGGTSYGSMTAAGLWGLFLCGVNKGDGRLKDALQWLDHDHYSVSANTPIGNKWVYYYDLGLAKAYLMAEARGCKFGKTNWYEDLYAFLSDKQDKKDGHWHNIEGEHSCDVLATAEAILALSVKEIPAKISKLSYMVFKLRSAADLHIYDPEGRHVGLNTETGEVEIGIPDATYTENPIEIKVPNLEAGGYKAVLIGTEAGEYELEVIAKTGNKTLAEASYEGWITEGATQEMITTISSIVGPLDVRLGTLEAVVEEEDSYSEQFSLDAGDELEIDAIDETGVLLRIEAEEECEGEVKIMDYSENPTIKGFPGEYKYCALEKYVDISLDVDKEKIDWPIYLEVHYDEDELPENVDESTLTMYHYMNDTKWRSCNDFEVNPEENYISAELEKDELCYFGMGGLYAPIWVRYSMILAVMAIVIVLALGYFSVRRHVKSRRVKAMKVPERVPAEVAITIYNFDNSFSLLNEREETTKISDGLDGRLASGEIKEETYNDLKSKYKSKIGDLNRKIKSELERAKAYLQRIEDEQTKLQRTHENLNAELQKEKGRKKKAEISAKVAEISAEIESVEGIVKTMKEKIGVIEGEFSGD